MVSGTPSYLSPEIARGEDPSPASDVWALGATLFAAVEGRPPYSSQPNPLATLANIVGQPPPRPERAGVLTEPIRRMMDPDPQSRWDVADAAHALRRIHARHRTDRTREETAAFGAGAGALAAPTRPHPEPPHRRRTTAPTPEPTPEPTERTPAPSPPARTPAPPPGRAAAPEAGRPAGAGDRRRPGDPGGPRDATCSTTIRRGTRRIPPRTPAPRAGARGDEPRARALPRSRPAASREAFVEDYYAALPDDTETGWSQLSPDFQQEVGSYEDYDGFWSTIDSVTVEDVQAAGPGAVDATLVYTTDGSSQSEVRRIELTGSEGDYLISGDEIVG